jgi:hypothetical protein
MSVEALARPVRTPPSLACGAVGILWPPSWVRGRERTRGSVSAASHPTFANGCSTTAASRCNSGTRPLTAELAGSPLVDVESAPCLEPGGEVVRPDGSCPHRLRGSAGKVVGRR